MNIISWNCNGKFREKYKVIIEQNADIYIIQECEDPNQSKDVEYKKFAENSIWIGSNKNKGLGIFAKSHIKLFKLNWSNYCLKWFLPVLVNDDFVLVGIWACKPYIEEYYIW